MISGVRKPLGRFGGKLATVSATRRGGIEMKGEIEKAGIDGKEVTEVYMGNVLQANLGQAPARQAAIFAGLPTTTFLSGIMVFEGTKHKAPTIQLSPITTLSITTEFIPTNTFFPIVPPCTMAP